MALSELESNFLKLMFAGHLKKIRTQKNMTLKQLAEASSVDLQAIYRYEHASSEPSAFNVFKLAQALGVTMGELFGSANPYDIKLTEFTLDVIGINAYEEGDNLFITVKNEDNQFIVNNLIPKHDIDAITDYALDTCAPIVREIIISGILQLLNTNPIEQKDKSNESISESSTTNNPA